MSPNSEIQSSMVFHSVPNEHDNLLYPQMETNPQEDHHDDDRNKEMFGMCQL